MHDAIKFLSPIVDRTPGSGIYSCYQFRNDSIIAHSRAKGIVAGVPMSSPTTFNVPAAEFDAVLTRMKEVTELTVDGDSLLIKGGRVRATIELNQDEVPTIQEPAGEWKPSPPGLAAALKMALPFVHDRGWAVGVLLTDNEIVAVSNRAGIRVAIPLAAVPSLLPAPTAALITTDPAEYAQDENAIHFRWEDGTWLRSQLVDEKVPEPEFVERLFAGAESVTPVQITDEMRECYADAAAVSDGVVWVLPVGFQGRKGVGKTLAECDTGAKVESCWNVALLDAIMPVASAWHPNGYPNAVRFVGEGVQGIVVGVRR